MRSNNFIYITTQFEGFHAYPEAPKEVEFLKNLHRHLFKVKIWIEVFHNDRDIEFFIFKTQVDTLIQNSDLYNASCEMISDYLYNKIKLTYPDREIRIEVNEDGENGSYKEYKKTKS